MPEDDEIVAVAVLAMSAPEVMPGVVDHGPRGAGLDQRSEPVDGRSCHPAQWYSTITFWPSI